MRIDDSVQQILAKQDEFVPRFYEAWFAEHPESRGLFAGFNIDEQRSKLTYALMTVQRHSSVGGWVSENYLRSLGRKHDVLGIDREWYPDFIDVLIQTLSDFHGNQWTSVLESDWRKALEAAVEVMLEQYGSDDTKGTP